MRSSASNNLHCAQQCRGSAEQASTPPDLHLTSSSCKHALARAHMCGGRQQAPHPMSLHRPPLCCDGVMHAPSILTHTCSDARNAQRNDCAQVHEPCAPALAFLLLHRPLPMLGCLFAPNAKAFGDLPEIVFMLEPLCVLWHGGR